MKMKLLVGMLAALMCVSYSHADAVSWWSSLTLSGGTIQDRFGNDILQTSDWAARILTVSSSNQGYSTALGAGTQWSDPGADGEFYLSFDYNSVGNPLNGSAIFTRFYDNADWTLATHYADVGFSTINWPSAVPPATPNSYDYVTGPVVAGDWQQVVPEPATALLFGIGGMGAWMIRRNKLKSKEEADA